MSDIGFPVIEYQQGASPRQWGINHGESYRNAIAEVLGIRRELLYEKNPRLTPVLVTELAQQQWQANLDYDPQLTEELQGICDGSGISREDVIIVNNYTDFRDIQVSDQGCSVVVVNYNEFPVVGQTWDMHGSAKNYVCCIKLPQEGFDEPAILFSIVGCVGMMGFHPRGAMVGVNNINTDGARVGAAWPCIVRRVIEQPTHEAMVREMVNAPVTSGHAYLLSTIEKSDFWEVMPDLSECVDTLNHFQDGYLFHTNHCLGEKARHRETVIAQNSTTHIRYQLLEKKIASIKSLDDVCDLMNDHENYPKSICSNFQASSQDPSITCGGAAGEIKTGTVKMWRGDPVYDENYCCREFNLGVPNLA